MIGILIFILLMLPQFLTWAVIHEMSHVLMAKALLKVTEWTIRPYPHFHEYDGNRYFVWALSLWRYDGETTPSKNAAIHLAPRIMDMVAAVGIHAYWFMPDSLWTLPLVAFCIGGLIDLAVGSSGATDVSDLKRASDALEISPWWLRITGWAAVLAGLPVVVSQLSRLL
jgi:hypothetical protein